MYCHPSSNSFTFKVKESFIKGVIDAGHSFVISDLYAMGFNPVFSENEYLREAFYDDIKDVGNDVLEEQQKINDADVIVFIFPIFGQKPLLCLLVGFSVYGHMDLFTKNQK